MTIFREEIVELLPALRAFARSLTGGNVSLADDLVQDTMVNALKSQDKFEPGTNLKAWTFTILRNRFFSLQTRKHVSSEVGTEDLEGLAWVAPEQESRIEVAAFKRAFANLKPQHREVLVLTVLKGLPYDEVAKICGCEVGTVKSRVNRARATLKKMLMDDELPVDGARLARNRKVRPLDADAPIDVPMQSSRRLSSRVYLS